jgi:hypothetical protein
MARLLLLCAALLLLVSGCGGGGGEAEEPRTFAEDEGYYLELGEIEYQVQFSRQLNEEDVFDRDLLLGIAEDVEDPADDEAWFGVFVRAWNHHDEELPLAQRFEIVDANQERYQPVPLDEDSNVFARWPEMLGPGREAPAVDSVPHHTPIGGRLVLFKIPYETFEQRPLEFRIIPRVGDAGTVSMDV